MPFSEEGKGPGYAGLWGLVALLFAGPIAYAGFAGMIPWWGAAGANVVIWGLFAFLMATAKWATWEKA